MEQILKGMLPEACCCVGNGCVAVEPILVLDVSLLQYLEAIPDCQAVEMLHCHAGWNFAWNGLR
jgi:hypothetical protein